MSTVIHVTLDDIYDGIRASCTRCPVALAAIRAGFANVRVGVAHLYWTSSEDDLVCRLPPDAVAFACDFDNKQPVVPFDFEVDAEP